MPSATNKAPFNVAIVGGGISGLSLALALIERHIHVQIYEQTHEFKEIGAGVTFTPNAVKAMNVCSPIVREAYELVATGNAWPEKKNVFFDMHDGYTSDEVPWLFNLTARIERPMTFRAHFLDHLAKHIPADSVVLGKRVESIDEAADADGQMIMNFTDGTSAKADIVIGCDGIKSQVRKAVIGANHPAVKPVYSHMYAYRGLIPAEEAIPVIGEDLTVNAKMIFGKDGHFITFPVADNTILNVVAFVHDSGEWTALGTTRLGKREEAERDFAQWSKPVRKLISMLEPELEVWGIFDTLKLPHYNKGRICLVGDAAHATTPHHGAGAGMGIEDCAVMAILLSDIRIAEAAKNAKDRSEMHKALAAAFAAFDALRRERTQWLVQSSRRCGELHQWRTDDVQGPEDKDKMKEELEWRHHKVWKLDAITMYQQATQELGKQLSKAGLGHGLQPQL